MTQSGLDLHVRKAISSRKVRFPAAKASMKGCLNRVLNLRAACSNRLESSQGMNGFLVAESLVNRTSGSAPIFFVLRISPVTQSKTDDMELVSGIMCAQDLLV